MNMCNFFQAGGDNGNSMEFPTTNLYELEGRVFTDTWSIPYKREESLGKCLVAATRLAEEGIYVILSILCIRKEIVVKYIFIFFNAHLITVFISRSL